MENNLTMGFRLDDNGYIVERPVVNPNDTLPDNVILNPPIMPFIKPKWNGTKWIEGATQEEIDEMTKVEPLPSSENEELLNYLLDVDMRLVAVEMGLI